MPLYIAALFQGVAFWYATEKLFMLQIGFTTATIGVMVAIMSVVMLAVETPSGILADRWSRKGVMILGGISLMISGITGALSFNEPMYILSTVFWGIFAALYSGTYDSVLYDTAVEEHGNADLFEKYLGRFRAIEGVAFVIGSLVGSAIASAFEIRTTYIVSIPMIGVGMFFLWKFKEPQLHKAEVAEPVFTHIRQTFAAVLRNPALLPLVIAIVGFAVLQDTVFELSQLWFIAVMAPTALYGVFSATVFSSWATGALLANRTKSRLAMTGFVATVLLALIGLIFARNYGYVLVAQFAFALCLVALNVVMTKKLHDALPSKLRAGSASVVSTLSRTILIPGTLIFTFIADKNSVFTATYMLLGIAVIAAVAFAFSLTKKYKTT